MKRIIIFYFCLVTVQVLYSQDNKWLTYYEMSACKKTPRYNETVEFCRKLDSASTQVKFTDFGISPQGRALPILIVDKNGHFTPEEVRKSGNAVVLVQACIHAGECEGKDAGLCLIRDIIIDHKYPELLDHVTLLFIPIFNVDGHERFGPYNRINQNGPEEMGWRVTAQDLNLNRDYIKADAPEMQCWLKLFNQWLPEFFVDCHTTDGADYQYVVTYGLENYGNTDKDLTAWQKDVYLKEAETSMNAAGFPLIPYINFRDWNDLRSGLEAGVSPPILSTGYTAVRNRTGLLIETHMLKDYKTRVNGTYEMLKTTLSIVNKEYKTLQTLEAAADTRCAGAGFRKEKFPLGFDESKTDSVMMDFKGFEYSDVKSDLTGGSWIKYSKNKKDFRIPFFNNTVVTTSANLPEGYIIPPEWTAVIGKLKLHGVSVHTLKQVRNIKVKTWIFHDPKWQEKPYEGRHPLQVQMDSIETVISYPAGSAIIDMNQSTARLVAYILEPASDYSFLHWGFFDAIFEQKEYAESYVMEGIARDMLAKDPGLKKEFEEKKANDKHFAASQREILNWFYNKSPYHDSKMNLYPVGKIFDRKEMVNGEW
ncbi:MAG: M14 family metallopeptidase [Bacteroidia bacterium]|nr:M14 family metallopeptidase [Bacteroidia bacterium]